jgi:hypothetical protein
MTLSQVRDEVFRINVDLDRQEDLLLNTSNSTEFTAFQKHISTLEHRREQLVARSHDLRKKRSGGAPTLSSSNSDCTEAHLPEANPFNRSDPPQYRDSPQNLPSLSPHAQLSILPHSQQPAPVSWSLRICDVPLRKLRSIFHLERHYQQCEQVFVETGHGEFINGFFWISPSENAAAHNKFSESLSDFSVVMDAFDEAISSFGYNWHSIKSHLIERFARRELIKSEFERRISALKFKGPPFVDIFIEECHNILQLFHRMYLIDNQVRLIEQAHLVRSILSKLPDDNKRQVFRRILALSQGH